MKKCLEECFNKYEIEASQEVKRSKRCSLGSKDILAIEICDPNYKKMIKDLLDSYESHSDIKAIDVATKLRDRLLELNCPDEDTIFNKIGIDRELMHLSTIY